jgi:hypothetical protein
MLTLAQYGVELVKENLTTISEVIRVCKLDWIYTYLISGRDLMNIVIVNGKLKKIHNHFLLIPK